MSTGPKEGIAAARDVTVEHALALAAALAPPTEPEPVPLAAAVGRRLAAPVRARIDLPPADGSAMDGYAVRAADTPGALRLVGESAAGAPFAGRVEPGRAVAISTGALMPAGADAVLRREDAVASAGAVSTGRRLGAGESVRRRAEVIARGAELLPAGAWVAARHLGAIGAVGLASVTCHRRPRVALLAAGRELVPLGAPAGPETVYDASRLGLAAQAEAAGAEVTAVVTVGDDRAGSAAAVAALLDPPHGPAPDLLVTTGGMGDGPHDHLRRALAACGVKAVLHRVAASPCRPTWLGRRGAQVVLGLPGNPVSAAVALHLLGRPLLGHGDEWWRTGILTADVPAHLGLAELLRVAETPAGLVPLPDQDSHAITSLAGATALAWITGEAALVPAGTMVRLSPLGG